MVNTGQIHQEWLPSKRNMLQSLFSAQTMERTFSLESSCSSPCSQPKSSGCRGKWRKCSGIVVYTERDSWEGRGIGSHVVGDGMCSGLVFNQP